MFTRLPMLFVIVKGKVSHTRPEQQRFLLNLIDKKNTEKTVESSVGFVSGKP
jgi:hypothetical protein